MTHSSTSDSMTSLGSELFKDANKSRCSFTVMLKINTKFRCRSYKYKNSSTNK